MRRAGDIWKLGPYRLLCADARSPEAVAKLMNGVQATMMFTDPPYNMPIDGHVSGLGRFKHREFEVAAGEMDETAFTEFLRQTLAAAATQLKDGAIAFVCMDWRHMRELLFWQRPANVSRTLNSKDGANPPSHRSPVQMNWLPSEHERGRSVMENSKKAKAGLISPVIA